jgi:proteasome lid subunit RPN8/RPN11
MALTLTRAQRQELIDHALEGRPYEVCGLLAGKDDRVERVYRAANKERSPVRYEIDPKDLIRIFREIDNADLELVGIYHSHTHTDAYPSATDVRLAYYPEAYYVLVSLMDERSPRVRAFRIRDGQISEVPIDVVD